MKDLLLVLLLVSIAIVILLGYPYLAIWSLNTLFSLSIPFTLKTWAAALLLLFLVQGSRGRIND